MILDKKKIKIRNYKEGDYWFCYWLTKRNMLDYVTKYQGGWDSKTYKKYFEKKYLRIVEYGGKKIGFYNLQKREKEIFLIDLQISKKFQNKGLGTFLLHVIEGEAKKFKVKKLTLGAYHDNPVRNLYKRLGFKNFLRKKHFVVMCKNV